MDSFVNIYFFRNKLNSCLYEKVIESFTQSICLKTVIHLETKHVTVIMSESLTHLFKRFIRKHGFIQEQNK